jgi:hypothetical protein
VCVFSLFFQTCCVSMSKPVAHNKLGIYVCILINKKDRAKESRRLILFFFTLSVNRIAEFTKMRLRAPPDRLIQQWAKKMGVSKERAHEISVSLPLRHRLGQRTCQWGSRVESINERFFNRPVFFVRSGNRRSLINLPL